VRGLGRQRWSIKESVKPKSRTPGSGSNKKREVGKSLSIIFLEISSEIYSKSRGMRGYMAVHNVRWLGLEVRKIGTGQGSSSIARRMKKLQFLKIEGEDWRSYFDEILTCWRKIETMPGS
jgi:hypothetical protein